MTSGVHFESPVRVNDIEQDVKGVIVKGERRAGGLLQSAHGDYRHQGQRQAVVANGSAQEASTDDVVRSCLF